MICPPTPDLVVPILENLEGSSVNTWNCCTFCFNLFCIFKVVFTLFLNYFCSIFYSSSDSCLLLFTYLSLLHNNLLLVLFQLLTFFSFLLFFFICLKKYFTQRRKKYASSGINKYHQKTDLQERVINQERQIRKPLR